MPNLNPLTAKLSTSRATSGLWSAVVDCDAGALRESIRVHVSRGWLSESEARASGNRIAARLGRALIAAAALACIMSAADGGRASARAEGAEGNPPALYSIEANGESWLCASAAGCRALLRSMDCDLIAADAESAVAICTPRQYRRARALRTA